MPEQTPDWKGLFERLKGQRVVLSLRLEYASGATMVELQAGPQTGGTPMQVENRATVDGQVEEAGVEGFVLVRQSLPPELAARAAAAGQEVPAAMLTYVPYVAISHVGAQSALAAG